MCVNNDFIENQSYRIYEEICKSSLFKIARVEFLEGYCWEPQFDAIPFNKNNLISKIILKDDKNNSFTINPDDIGLKFAKGDISYKEYLRSQKIDDFKWFGFSILGVGILISMMLTIYIYLN